MEKIPGDYVAGFVDGEGCFALTFRKDRQKDKITGKVREYFYWKAQFAIVLRPDDATILDLIKNTLDCGLITTKKKGDQVRLSVQDTNDLYNKIIPFFTKHPLRAKKLRDFILWSEAVEILYKNKGDGINVLVGKRGFIKKEIPTHSLERLGEIRIEMLKYKSIRENDFLWRG